MVYKINLFYILSIYTLVVQCLYSKVKHYNNLCKSRIITQHRIYLLINEIIFYFKRFGRPFVLLYIISYSANRKSVLDKRLLPNSQEYPTIVGT